MAGMLSDLSGGDQVLGTRSSRGDHAVDFSLSIVLTQWGSLSSLDKPNETRTRDLLLTRQALCHLSHATIDLIKLLTIKNL
ncbi:hypothetical protein OUZ56_017129 [Daphnia magna]|uniref:Uncharacterized protein n=1 Tax=Daphnia magna TaxID=35525 RepID=A0ABR0ASN5_9CRUS|nr:hypothetical protein OUZ56_017129 [Daphnia magna]